MAATLETMLALTRLKLKDLRVRQWSEPELVASANEGKNELVKLIRQARSDYFETSVTGTMTTASAPNPTTITLPSDFAELKEIICTDSGYQDIGFTYCDQSDVRFKQALIDGGAFANGQGMFYYTITDERTLLLSPGSDVALNYKIWYVKTIPDMQFPSDAPTGIPPEHWDFIVTHMVCECMRSAADPRLDLYLAKMSDQGKSVRASVGQRQIKEAQFVDGYMESFENWG
jgi:hypothetical protein